MLLLSKRSYIKLNIKLNLYKYYLIVLASDSLRRHYINSIENVNLDSTHNVYRLKKRFYVEPTIVEVKGSYDDSSNTESITNNKGYFTMKTLTGLINQHNFLLLQGAGGMGKTFVMENTALQWARQEIWNDVDFVFLLKFRKLFKHKNLEESLTSTYESVFHTFSYGNLKKGNNKIVFLLDGLDEYHLSLDAKNFDEDNCGDTSLLSGIHALANSNCMVFPHAVLILSGRPSSCQLLKSSMKMKFIPTFETIGFSNEQVGDYLHLYFKNKTDVDSINRVIKASKSLQRMSKVPAFLWSLCELYREKRQLRDITTMTELYVLQLTIFLQRHFKSLNGTIKSTNSVDMYKYREVQDAVFSLAEIAAQMLENNTKLIDVEKNNSVQLKQLEETGIVYFTEASDQIQFHHSSMQEFLAAIYYHQTIGSIADFFTKSHLSGCFPFFAGLQGATLSYSKSPRVVIDYVKNLGLENIVANTGLTVADIAILTKIAEFLPIFFEYHNRLSPKSSNPFLETRNQLCIEIIRLPYEFDVESEKCLNFKLRRCGDYKNFNNFAKDLLLKLKLRNVDSLQNINASTNRYFSLYYNQMIETIEICTNAIAAAHDFCQINTANQICVEQYLNRLNIATFCSKIRNGKFDADAECHGDFNSLRLCELFYLMKNNMKNDQLRVESLVSKLIHLYGKCNESVNDYNDIHLHKTPSLIQSESHLIYFLKNYGKIFRNSIHLLLSDTTLSAIEIDTILNYICRIKELYLFDLPFYENLQLQLIVDAIIHCSSGTTQSRLSTVLIDFFPVSNHKTILSIELLLSNIRKFKSVIIRVHSNIHRLFKLINVAITQPVYARNSKLEYLKIVLSKFKLFQCEILLNFIWGLKSVNVTPFNKYHFNNNTVSACGDKIIKMWKMKLQNESRLQYFRLGNLIIEQITVTESPQSYFQNMSTETVENFNDHVALTLLQVILCNLGLLGMGFSAAIFVHYKSIRNKSEAWLFSGTVVCIVSLCCIMLLYNSYTFIEGCQNKLKVYEEICYEMMLNVYNFFLQVKF